MTGELIPEPVGSNNRRAITPMKDRKFWEDLIHIAQDRWKSLESRIQKLHQHRVKESTAEYRRPYRDRALVQRLESRIAYLSRLKTELVGKITFYQGRIKVLEQRTRYQRILRSPVIAWPSVKSVRYPTGRRSA